MSENGNVIFEIKGMKKSFGPTIALKGIDFVLKRGEIHGLVGENGSGKSTATSILSGMQQCDSGEMYFLGNKWEPKSMIESQKNGISMILQEANTIKNVTVAENLFAGKENDFSKFGIISMQKMYKAADELLQSFDITHIKGKDIINKYGFEDRKLIEICRAVNDDTQILVVDETTTALSQHGRELLYKLINKMAEKGKAIIFISHDMDEILEVCNIVTVLRDGDIIGTLGKEEMDPKPIRLMMVGREIGEAYYRDDFDGTCTGETVLEYKNCTIGRIKDFNLELHKGEILGIGGLSGSGMHEIGKAGFGIIKPTSGQVLCNGTPVENCLSAIRHNIGYISKNRDEDALILQGSIQDNINLPSTEKLIGKFGYISKNKSKELANKQIDSFSIKCKSGNQYVSTLSGGNKQKVSFAKWSARDSDIFIMDCPTRGVDIGVKQSMYALINQMKKDGKAILMISEEISELIGMCDKIVIMKDNKISGTVMRDKDLKQTDIIEYII